MESIVHSQTKRSCWETGMFSLPVFKVSPYFNIGRGAIIETKMTVKFFVQEYIAGGSGVVTPYGTFTDISTNTFLENFFTGIDVNTYDTKNDVINAWYTAVVAEAVVQGYTGFTQADIIDLTATNLPVAPTSYQTIVSQTGTAAPAVSGSLTPTSTYPSGTTFMWARTGAGVYTLTASSAVFDTSGKTGVFTAPLQNLNGSIRTVVTSSTVITVTTAIQSLAVLGLLGFAATNTDALLNQTMIYVQTYA